MRERAAIAPAEVLYHSRRDDVHHRVYVHRSEEAMLVTNNQEDRSFIQEQSFDQQELDKITVGTRGGLSLNKMGLSERRLGAIQKEASRQAVSALQQFINIHSIKTKEYKKRSG
uniref:Uncharacterized protein n=1 Tax=Musa acuminata subsp. malaccensis TaxID=214687 RepID=A0A804HNJ2_MUSAM